jgi:hypothetical protein
MFAIHVVATHTMLDTKFHATQTMFEMNVHATQTTFDTHTSALHPQEHGHHVQQVLFP